MTRSNFHEADDLGLQLAPGDRHYRAFVGPPADYDLVAAMSLGLLVALGLRQHHRILDIGCGSLRVGRLLIPYLNRGGYTGLEPNAWLVEEGLEREVGRDQAATKAARFSFSEDASDLLAVGERYDYLLAQSIFSHCGTDLLSRWLSRSAALLSDDGILVATYVHAEQDSTESGWIYPECVAFREETIAALATANGLHFSALDWKHPRQRWVAFSKAPIDPKWSVPGGLAWNAAFDRYDARRQRI